MVDKKDRGPRVVTLHSNINIYRNIHEAHTGPVTDAERVKALERLVRWHERQVVVGKATLAYLLAKMKADETATPATEAPDAPQSL